MSETILWQIVWAVLAYTGAVSALLSLRGFWAEKRFTSQVYLAAISVGGAGFAWGAIGMLWSSSPTP